MAELNAAKQMLRDVIEADDSNMDPTTCLPYELTERIRTAVGAA